MGSWASYFVCASNVDFSSVPTFRSRTILEVIATINAKQFSPDQILWWLGTLLVTFISAL